MSIGLGLRNRPDSTRDLWPCGQPRRHLRPAPRRPRPKAPG